MDQEKNECEKVFHDEVMLPGFRFHPTDEELVGFYLTRKVHHKPLSIELIRQLDIYKYDPWDLPKLAATGEKEWYFYCPRDRKYRNSARPNRVTGAGFWKATGTDRPIYSSQGSKCIGLKKSLVFYKGRAAKGIKTDWMMHEFRLPSVSDSVSPNKRFLDKNIPATEAWAICRIFKKANSSTQRALSHSWVSPSFDTTSISDMINPDINAFSNNTQFSSSTITMANMTNTPLQFGFCNDIERSSISSFSPSHFPTFASSETCVAKSAINDASSLLLEMSTSVFGDFGYKGSGNVGFSSMLQEQCTTMPVQGNIGEVDDQCGIINKSMGFPNYSFPMNLAADAWKSNLVWPEYSSPCPSDQLSTSFSTNKCYTS